MDRFRNAQISIVKEGDITPAIEELKQKLWKAQKEKDVMTQKQIEKELEQYLQRKILITIADNYVNLRRREQNIKKLKDTPAHLLPPVIGRASQGSG